MNTTVRTTPNVKIYMDFELNAQCRVYINAENMIATENQSENIVGPLTYD